VARLEHPVRDGVPRRRWTALVAVASLALPTAGCTIGRGDHPEPDPVQIELPAQATVPDLTYQPQPERGFIWVGENESDQFTDAQLEQLATGYDIVVLAKFHAHYDIAAHHEAARRLVAMRPDIRVFPYFSMRYWFEKNQWGETIRPEWLLRDATGELVEREGGDSEDRGRATFVDLANPAYRAWALRVMASWLKEAPYAGIAFDATAPLGEGDSKSVAEWEDRLGPERVKAYDSGLRELLASAKALVGAQRTIIYNGIAPNPRVRGADRNIGLLDIADAALDERFCLDVDGESNALDDDIHLLSNQPDGELLMRTAIPSSTTAEEAANLEAFCVGAFLAGWQPGRSYFQAGRDYTTAQLDAAAPDLSVNLGQPLGPYLRRGDLVQRPFEHGVVVVNLGSSPVSVTVNEAVTEVGGGRVIGQHPRGEELVVGGTTAVFLLRGPVRSPEG
jgi:hypothetical protein